MEEIDVLEKEKIRKLNEIKEKEVNPYPYSYDRDSNSEEIKNNFVYLKEEEHSNEDKCVAGRVIAIRKMGRASFMHIKDQKGKLQLYMREDKVGKQMYKFLKKLDIGDFIGAKGEVFKTKTGEISLFVESYELLSKSIKPLPEKYHGLKNKELRYRQRYLDLIMNDEVRDIFTKRSIIMNAIREFLNDRGYMEVETPLLQTQYGGAKARPFETYINAWDMKMFLSISPELYLKRLIVGGFEKVYTICKNFRNEGVDQSHNPEFTMIEIYEAYKDYNDMMKLMEECYEFVSIKVNGTTKVKKIIDGKEIIVDLKAPWPRITMSEAIEKYLGIDVNFMSQEELLDFAVKNNLDVSAHNTWGELVIEVFELVEEKIIQPTHVYDHPKEGTPLCKRNRKDSRFNEQCEPVGFGMELANMYSELNDPLEQERLLQEQSEKGRGGDEEAHPMDEDFINSIKIGMPPTGGIGWGVDRMVMILTGAESIRDVILFPTMKPEEASNNDSGKEKKTEMAVALINKGANLEKWQELNTVAHLNAAFGARAGQKLFYQDSFETSDGKDIKFNIKNAIMIKEASNSAELMELKEKAKAAGLEVSEFVKEMIDTSDNQKLIDTYKNKSQDEAEYLGLLIFGKKSDVQKLTKNFNLYK